MPEMENSGRLAFKGGQAKANKKTPLGPRGGNTADDDNQTVEQRYQKKTQLQHILLRPDTYIGSIEKMTQDMWVYDEASDSIVKRLVTYVPGLYKIFDEIIVNAADNKQRDANMSKLKVTVDAENGSISVWNDGKGIPIQMHKEHHMYVPELIFGNLLTGSNFDDDQKKTTGGRNGFGAKLANIYSTEFVVETADERAGKHYRQVFRNNMQDKEEPVIDEDYDGSDFTCITFRPDWKRFHMSGMEADTIALLKKRVYDMAGCMGGYGGARMKVFLDKKRLQVSSFKEYMGMFEGMETPVIFEKISDRWEVGIGLSADNVFQQVSYVNAISTIKGGTHVECVANQVIAKLLPVLKRKNKSEVKGHFVKNHLCVFVNGLVENPAFNSQSKEALTSKDTAFGSVPKISEAALKTIEKSEIVDSVLSWAKHKQNQQLNKKSGKKASKLTGITKLDDANHAGTARSQDCTLILTEGDSAKPLVVSGLGVIGRDKYGVFPLKGKLLNVREATNPQVLKNEEIQNVVKIMGLKFNHDYQDTKSLRYGHLMIMTDQDHDGSHIKGLLINFLHHYWPSLLKIDGFLQVFVTPIVKVTKGSREVSFYTVPEYNTWKEGHNNGKGWFAKYYKGLGTSTTKEAKGYFAELDTHQLEFEWKDDSKDSDLIDMAFSKKRVEDRKDWLRAFKTGTHADFNVESVTYDSFINKELILFSMEDNKRSIPCLVDGFKPSQRKVLFSCFKRNLRKEIKVAQLAGYVSEHSSYHHGEMSLNGTITGMAQNFTGSNNINLLNPGGQFGTRLMGGKDAASPRYIFTSLQKAARAIFHPDDDALLTYLEDDGRSIEPEYYMPVLPLILVNGADGIGTGWSSQVPNYSPRDVIANLRRRINDQAFVEMQPWYDGYAGCIEAKVGKKGIDGGFSCRGIVKRIDDTTVEITELPVRRWTQDYKQFLEGLLVGAEDAKAKATSKAGSKKGDKADKDKAPTRCVKDFKENHTDTTVHFTVTMSMEDLDSIEKGDGLYKFFKLESSLTTSNMVLFDQDGQLIKYETPQHILEEFFQLRMEFYHRRRINLLAKLHSEKSKLDNKVRFILAVVEGRLKVNNRKKADLLGELKAEGYDLFLPVTAKASVAGAGGDNDEEEDGVDGDQLSKGFDYLLGMKLWSLTLERVRMLEVELQNKTEETAQLQASTASDLWVRDLDALGVVLDEIAEEVRQQELEDAKQRKIAGKRNGGGRAKGRSGKAGNDDSDFEDGPSKKAIKSKARTQPLPPPPNRAVVPELVLSAAGGKVSAAFAEAEMAGKVVTGVKAEPDTWDSEGFGRSDEGDENKASQGIDGCGFSRGKVDDFEPPTGKMASLSLAERVKEKYGDTSAAALPVKPQRTARKPSASAVADSDDSDDAFRGDDNDNDEVIIAHKARAAVAPPKRKARAATSKAMVVDSDFEQEDEEDDNISHVVKDEVVDTNTDAKARPSRAARTTRKIIAEVESDDDDDDMESDQMLDSDAVDDEEDGYEPTPVKPKRNAIGKGTAAAGSKKQPKKSTAAARPAVKTAGGMRANIGAKAKPEVTHVPSSGESDEDEAIETKIPPARTARSKAAAEPVQSYQIDDSEDDVFNMDDSGHSEQPLPKSRGKPIGKAKAPVKAKAKAKTPTKAKGVKRGSRMSISDEDEVFSPDKLSPPTKRVSQKATPAASRLRASKPLKDDSDDDEDEDSDSDVQEVTKTPRPARRGGRARQVVYAEVDSDESEEEEEDRYDDDDDESEFEG